MVLAVLIIILRTWLVEGGRELGGREGGREGGRAVVKEGVGKEGGREERG